MPRAGAPDVYTSRFGGNFQDFLKEGRQPQDPSMAAAPMADNSPTAMPPQSAMPRVPAPPAPEAPTIDPASRPSLSDRAMGAVPTATGGEAVAPSSLAPDGMPTFDRAAEQQWQGRGGYYYSYKPGTDTRPASITMHGGEFNNRAGTTILANGEHADAFERILREAEGMPSRGAYVPLREYQKQQDEAGNRSNISDSEAVERISDQLVSESFPEGYLETLRRGFSKPYKEMPQKQSMQPGSPMFEDAMAQMGAPSPANMQSLDDDRKRELMSQMDAAIQGRDEVAARATAQSLAREFPDAPEVGGMVAALQESFPVRQ